MDRNHTNYALLDLDLSLHRCAQNDITSDEILQLLKASNLSIVTNMLSGLESKSKEREVYLLKILQAIVGMLEVDAMVLDGQGFNTETERNAIEWTRKEIERLQKP